MNRDRFKEHLDDLTGRIANSDHKVVYLRVNSEVALTHIYLNMDQSKEVWLSIFHATDDMQLNSMPSINGLKILNIVHETGKKGTIIGKEGHHDERIYHHFLIHLADELSNFNNSSLARRRLQNLLHTWQEFFKGNRQPLGEQAQLGLMGELSVLNNLVLKQLKPQKALEAWKGPSRGLHDFVFELCHIEVKSSIGFNNRRFVIKGENQLSPPPEKQLYILNPVFEVYDDGRSLSDMVASVKMLISSDRIAMDIMETMLAKAGYHQVHSEYYLTEGLKLSFSSIITYQVGDGFPRLQPGSNGEFITVNDYTVHAEGCEGFLHKKEIRLV